jgi:hypothetical protein
MDNQHRQIKGYRELSQSEINTMNNIKELGKAVGDFIAAVESDVDVDKEWVAIAKTDLQKGFMSLNRAVTRPEFF